MKNNDRGQSLINKYVWVIETIYRRHKISYNDLNELWVKDTDISRGKDLPKRTFDNWRVVIGDMFGIDISNENSGRYRYYIENEEDINENGIRSWLYNAFSVSNALANSQSIKDRILLEYIPSGQEYLHPIISAMKENRVLNITYHSYWKDVESNFDVQPYCVKLFRQRWYMVAKSTYYDEGPRIYSLDRIRELNTKDETFVMPKDWNAEEYFNGCFGIIADQSVEKQIVKLKATAIQAKYIRDLKIHESQKEIERNEEYSIFTFNIRPQFDFQHEILKNGEEVEVLES
ncbi:MAG: WYL domain-containing protein, partial [Paludibacteraceae bacterium]|nr:WYL domain-containing protein [Paludibacteraceae bacterium]